MHIWSWSLPGEIRWHTGDCDECNRSHERPDRLIGHLLEQYPGQTARLLPESREMFQVLVTAAKWVLVPIQVLSDVSGQQGRDLGLWMAALVLFFLVDELQGKVWKWRTADSLPLQHLRIENGFTLVKVSKSPEASRSCHFDLDVIYTLFKSIWDLRVCRDLTDTRSHLMFSSFFVQLFWLSSSQWTERKYLCLWNLTIKLPGKKTEVTSVQHFKDFWALNFHLGHHSPTAPPQNCNVYQPWSVCLVESHFPASASPPVSPPSPVVSPVNTPHYSAVVVPPDWPAAAFPGLYVT